MTKQSEAVEAIESVDTTEKFELVKLNNYSVVNESELIEMADKYKNLVVTNETFSDAKKARMDLRNARYEIQNIVKDNKSILNEAKRKMDKKAEELIAIIQPAEDEIDSKIKLIEEEKARIKAEKEAEEKRIREERMARISEIQSTMTSRVIVAKTISDLDAILDELNLIDTSEESYGDMAIAASGMVQGIDMSIKQARARIEDEGRKVLAQKLAEAKTAYFNATSFCWDGPDYIDVIEKETSRAIESSKREAAIASYISIFQSAPSDDMTTDQISEAYVARVKELAEISRKEKEQKKQEETAEKNRVRDERRAFLTKKYGLLEKDWAGECSDLCLLSVEEFTDMGARLANEKAEAKKKAAEKKEVVAEKSSDTVGVEEEIIPFCEKMTIGDSVIIFTSDNKTKQDGETKVIVDSTFLCTVRLDEVSNFFSELKELIEKFSI